MNGIKLTKQVESYHPNQYGHSVLADEVARALLALPPGELFNVRPGQTLNYQFPVDGAGFDASTQWPGSDVVLSLTSPSGRVIDRDTVAADVTHEVGPTFESYHVTSAEPGTWTATLYGAQVAPEGEETRLAIHQAPVENLAPVARFQQSLSARALSVDGTTSSDDDGTVVEYLWEFGDGTSATGARVTHTYDQPGTYRVSLAIRDDRGRWAVTTGASTVEIPAYQFTGFFAPVDNPPVVNTTKAGSAVPVKFDLGGAFGTGVLAAGSPASNRVDCVSGAATDEIEQTVTAGASSLQYDATIGRYTYVWKTSGTWAGTCRRLTVTFDDGSAHSALFRFR
jgi:PKD repeat protein